MMSRRPPRSAPPIPFNPAREVAVRVLLRVLAGEAFASPALDAALSAHPLPGRDAGLATHIVYGTLRHEPSLRLALVPLLRAETHPKTQALLLAGSFEKLYLHTPTHAVVNEYVTLARLARLAPPGLVNAVLRRVEPVDAPPHELPGWLAAQFEAVYGPLAADIMQDLLTPQPLWLSVSQAGAALLEQEGSRVLPGVQGTERVELSRPLRASAAYQQGEVQPINPASLACVDALGDVSGQRVLDLAGGSGVKAAMLAARGAQVTSVDIAPRKHQAAQRNLSRLHLHAEYLSHDLTTPLDLPPAPLVLLDAPCTGSGTLRGNPEIKLRLTPQAAAAMAQLQGQMLAQAATLVAPGGLLVYAVCSVLPQEGPEVVGQFLSQHPDFTPQQNHTLELPHLELWNPAAPTDSDSDTDADAVPLGQLTLPLDGVDGFFIACLRRKAAPVLA